MTSRDKAQRTVNQAKTVTCQVASRDQWGNATTYTTEWLDGIHAAETVKASKLSLWRSMGITVIETEARNVSPAA